MNTSDPKSAGSETLYSQVPKVILTEPSKRVDVLVAQTTFCVGNGLGPKGLTNVFFIAPPKRRIFSI